LSGRSSQWRCSAPARKLKYLISCQELNNFAEGLKLPGSLKMRVKNFESFSCRTLQYLPEKKKIRYFSRTG